MIKHLKIKNKIIPINCGNDTCVSETGDWCKYNLLHTRESKCTCDLFNEELFDAEGGTGLSIRCAKCKEAEIMRREEGDNNACLF